jgi:hypothetical protein
MVKAPDDSTFLKLKRTLAELGLETAAVRMKFALKYNPNWRLQPRVPRGNREGGQWTTLAGYGSDGARFWRRLHPRQARTLREAFESIRPFLYSLPLPRTGTTKQPRIYPEPNDGTGRLGPPTPQRPLNEYAEFPSWSAFKSYLKSAGPGYEWHHIVEQRLADNGRFRPEQIHNTDNIIALPKNVHECIKRHMGSGSELVFNRRRYMVERWSYDNQYNYGINLIIRCATKCGCQIPGSQNGF